MFTYFQDTFAELQIPCTVVNASRKIPVVEYSLKKVLAPYTIHRTGLLSKCTPIDLDMAKKLLDHGYKKMSKFKRWCPVEVHTCTILICMYIRLRSTVTLSISELQGASVEEINFLNRYPKIQVGYCHHNQKEKNHALLYMAPGYIIQAAKVQEIPLWLILSTTLAFLLLVQLFPSGWHLWVLPSLENQQVIKS